MSGDSKMKAAKTETITRLSDPMISIKRSLNVIHEISHLVRANEPRNTQFINGAKKMEAHHVFPNDSSLGCGWMWIGMAFGSIYDI